MHVRNSENFEEKLKRMEYFKCAKYCKNLILRKTYLKCITMWVFFFIIYPYDIPKYIF